LPDIQPANRIVIISGGSKATSANHLATLLPAVEDYEKMMTAAMKAGPFFLC